MVSIFMLALMGGPTAGLIAATGAGAVLALGMAAEGGLGGWLKRVFASEEPEETAPAPAPAPAAAIAPAQAERIDPVTLALISAAAYAAVGRPVRVRRVTFLNQNTISAWAEVGRISIQSSHNVRRSL